MRTGSSQTAVFLSTSHSSQSPLQFLVNTAKVKSVWPSVTYGLLCPVSFFVCFKENTDYWIGLLGGLAWMARMHFVEGDMFWMLPLSVQQRLTFCIKLRNKMGDMTRFEIAT